MYAGLRDCNQNLEFSQDERINRTTECFSSRRNETIETEGTKDRNKEQFAGVSKTMRGSRLKIYLLLP